MCSWKDDFLISSNSWRGEKCISWFIFILAPDAPLLRDTRCNAPQTTFKFFVLPRQQIWNRFEFSTSWKNIRMLKVAESPLYVSHLHLPLSLTWLVARQSLELASIASRLPSFFSMTSPWNHFERSFLKMVLSREPPLKLVLSEELRRSCVTLVSTFTLILLLSHFHYYT